MKRIWVSILLAGSLAISAMPSSNAAVTPGSKCSKSGNKQTYKNKIFTCIKLGKKLYWDNGVALPTKASTSPEKLVCSALTAGSLNPANKRERCVMVDDYGDNGQGGYTKVFGFTQEGIIPESTLCRNDTQYWSNQTWYDGKWKCGYFVDGGSKWGWHTLASQFPSAIKQNYVVGNSARQGATSGTPGTSLPQCSVTQIRQHSALAKSFNEWRNMYLDSVALMNESIDGMNKAFISGNKTAYEGWSKNLVDSTALARSTAADAIDTQNKLIALMQECSFNYGIVVTQPYGFITTDENRRGYQFPSFQIP
jgi:hypothetical protein